MDDKTKPRLPELNQSATMAGFSFWLAARANIVSGDGWLGNLIKMQCGLFVTHPDMIKGMIKSSGFMVVLKALWFF